MLSFLTVVSLIQRDTVTVSAQLVESFSSDLLTFLTSNNPTALQAGIVALDKTAFGKKVRECLKTCNIPSSGFAGGAISGIKWRDQSSEVTAPILESHARIVENFTTLLSNAGLFEKKVQSEEKKAESKAKREEKAASALASEVAKLGLVDPLSIPELGVNAKLDCVLALLASGMLDSVQLKALMAASIQAVNSDSMTDAWVSHCTAQESAIKVIAADGYPDFTDQDAWEQAHMRITGEAYKYANRAYYHYKDKALNDAMDTVTA